MTNPEYVELRYDTYRFVESENGELYTREVHSIVLYDFPHLKAYIRYVFNVLYTIHADSRAKNNKGAPLDDYDLYGGYGIRLTNSSGSVIELGISKNKWLLMVVLPEPIRIIRMHIPTTSERTHGFDLFNCHHTEFGYDDLIDKSRCMEIVGDWLAGNNLPEYAG